MSPIQADFERSSLYKPGRHKRTFETASAAPKRMRSFAARNGSITLVINRLSRHALCASVFL